MSSPQKVGNISFLSQWIILITALLMIGGYIAYSQTMEYQYIDVQERLNSTQFVTPQTCGQGSSMVTGNSICSRQIDQRRLAWI